MRSSQTGGFSLFDPADYIADRETTLATAALIGGLDIANFDSLTIDDIVNSVRDIFPSQVQPLTTKMFGQHGIQQKTVNPAYLWNKKMQQKVLHKVRCDWRDLHMAKWVMENG